MSNIATLERLISEINTIKNEMIVEGYNKYHRASYDRLTFYTCHLPDTTKIMYDEWKLSVQRFIIEIGDMIILQSIREKITNLDEFFNGNNMNGEYPDIYFYFNSIIDDLNGLKIFFEVNKSNKVFIVHGHSELLIAQTDSFLQRLGFNPIILRNQANEGKTIIEKLEKYTDVAFAIILYTSCDRGGINDTNAPLKPRARQNVVFEHGYLNAKLGRNRVCALVEDGVEYPSDLSGVVYVPIDKNNAWMQRVAREMLAAGLDVDLNKVII